jgi:hypothetical protein
MPPPVAIGWVHYLPLITTAVCLVFCAQLFWRFNQRRSGAHLLWWGIGVFAFGLGTALESAITLGGNSVVLNKSWYIAGALCGGYPLAQGSVFLLMKRRVAWTLTAITLPLVIVLSVLVALSPVVIEALEQHRPSGAILGWQWIRWMTPIVNLYAAAFLVGGAVVSAGRYHGSREPGDGARATGNALIAIGALLPGIGGGMAKAGVVEALYVGEFIGIILIWLGYMTCVRASPAQAVSETE